MKYRLCYILPVYNILSHLCSSNAVVSDTPPSKTFTAETSMYCPRSFDRAEDVAGEISDGFNTTALPAATAPMIGSTANTLGDNKTRWKEEKEVISIIYCTQE